MARFTKKDIGSTAYCRLSHKVNTPLLPIRITNVIPKENKVCYVFLTDVIGYVQEDHISYSYIFKTIDEFNERIEREKLYENRKALGAQLRRRSTRAFMLSRIHEYIQANPLLSECMANYEFLIETYGCKSGVPMHLIDSLVNDVVDAVYPMD